MSLLLLIAIFLFIVAAFWNPPRVSLMCLGLAFLALWLGWPQALVI